MHLRRVLSAKPHLDGVAADAHVLLAQRQRPPGGDLQLQGDEIEAGDHLGHAMLDLQPRVHLHEIERAILVEQKF